MNSHGVIGYGDVSDVIRCALMKSQYPTVRNAGPNRTPTGVLNHAAIGDGAIVCDLGDIWMKEAGLEIWQRQDCVNGL